MPVSGFGVQNLETWRFLKNLAFPGLETLRLSTDLVFNVSKRCVCQRIWCSEVGNLVPVSRFDVQNAVPVSGFGVATLETLFLSTDLVFNVSKRCACQRIWCSESGNVAPVSGFGV